MISLTLTDLKEGLQKPTYMFHIHETKVLPSLCRAGTENMGNASGKNHLKYLKYLKANVTNKDIHLLQEFGQYAILGICPLFPATAEKSGEKDQQHNQTGIFKYHLSRQQLHTALPTVIMVCILPKGETGTGG